MSEPLTLPLLEHLLRKTPRRYRLAALQEQNGGPTARLAILIEDARMAFAAGRAPAPELEQGFVQAMAELIRDALREEDGDPVFQAVVLRHRSATVREHAALTAQAAQDRRQLLARVNAIAHPARLERQAGGPLRDTLAALHQAAATSAWPAMADALQRASTLTAASNDAALHDQLEQLEHDASWQRLCRLDALDSDTDVLRYQALWQQQGPPANSQAASDQGAASRRRGAEVETLAQDALLAIAQRLNTEEAPHAHYRVVGSLRVPAQLAAGHEGAKTEWDAVLLRQTSAGPSAHAWDIRLLIEAKASADATSTDLPRLLRGLRLLARADAHQDYVFSSRQGPVLLSGASLRALPTQADALAATVLYCSDAPPDKEPRLLSAASRMQLLSAPESLAYADSLIDTRRHDEQALRDLWKQLPHAPEWKAVFHQTLALRQARELMVHTDDLMLIAQHTDLSY